MSGIGREAFHLAYERCPIWLTGGIAGEIPGQALPIIALFGAAPFGLTLGATGQAIGAIAGAALDLAAGFASFIPLPNTELISNDVGRYPYANQKTAGNAIIAQPRQISMRMVCPASADVPWLLKAAIIPSLKASLEQHNSQGGLYTVITPSFFETGCVLTRMADASVGESKQAQNAFQFDFMRMLIYLEEAQQVYNNLTNQMAGGQQISGQPRWSGALPSGVDPSYSIGTLGAPASSPTPATEAYSGPVFP